MNFDIFSEQIDFMQSVVSNGLSTPIHIPVPDSFIHFMLSVSVRFISQPFRFSRSPLHQKPYCQTSPNYYSNSKSSRSTSIPIYFSFLLSLSPDICTYFKPFLMWTMIPGNTYILPFVPPKLRAKVCKWNTIMSSCRIILIISLNLFRISCSQNNKHNFYWIVATEIIMRNYFFHSH